MIVRVYCPVAFSFDSTPAPISSVPISLLFALVYIFKLDPNCSINTALLGIVAIISGIYVLVMPNDSMLVYVVLVLAIPVFS